MSWRRQNDFAQLASEMKSARCTADLSFCRISTDTRTLSSGDVFVALKGESFDGHAFIDQAIKLGAAGIVVESENEHVAVPQLVVPDTTIALGEMARAKRREFSGKVIGITGSCGKTSVKGMLREILECEDKTLATKGNLNNQIGVPLTLFELEGDERYAIVEAGTSETGEIKYLGNIIEPDVALVNNVQLSHLQGLKSIEAIAKEKGDLYRALNNQGTAVINLDDDYAEVFADENSHRRLIGFSLEKGVDRHFSGEIISVSQVEKDNLLKLNIGQHTLDIQLIVLGVSNASNALAAAACAYAVGASLESIKKGLERFEGVPGRMQTVKASGVELLIDDTYNANPGSVAAAIHFLSGFENTLMVFGEMGELAEATLSAHVEVGELSKRLGIKKLMCTGPNSLHSVGSFGIGAEWYETQADLISALKKIDLTQTTVLVKGSRYTKMENIVNAIVNFGDKRNAGMAG